jgi:hypothetical protein
MEFCRMIDWILIYNYRLSLSCETPNLVSILKVSYKCYSLYVMLSAELRSVGQSVRFSGDSVSEINRISIKFRKIFSVIPFYLQSVLVHSENCVKTHTVVCGRVLSSAHL